MKLPISFLLYTASLGLVGFTGWQVYDLLPLRDKSTKEAAYRKGIDEGTNKMTLGRSQGPAATDWYYTNANRPWWKQFQEANLVGRLPPPPPDENGGEGAKGTAVVEEKPATPLEEILDLAVLVYDVDGEEEGDNSYVIVRYKPTAAVEAPEWYVRELQNAVPAAFSPPDGVPPLRRQGNPNGPRGRGSRGANAQGEPMPTVPTTSGPLLQELWIQGEDDERRRPNLWPPYEHIRLVRVSPSAQSAFFVRAKLVQEDPEKPPERVDGPEEEFWKGTTDMSQEVLATLAQINGSEPGRPAQGTPRPGAQQSQWVDEPETRMVAKDRWNIGRDDARRYENEGSFLDEVTCDTYVSKVTNRRGVIVRNIKPSVAARYGVAEQDVLIEVNGRSVKTQAEAIQFGKREYKKGVRTFVTTWLSGGQEVTRTYQLPDK